MRSEQGMEDKPVERLCLWRATKGTLIFRAALVHLVMSCWLVFIVYWAISAMGLKKKAAGKTGRLRWLLTRCFVNCRRKVSPS
jgi:hypothetical protein